MRKVVFLAVFALSGAVLAEGGDEGLVERKYNPWRLTIGPVLAPHVRTRIHCSRQVLPAAALTQPKSGTTVQSGTSDNAPASPSAGYVNRQYADGHVGPDEGTEDPDTFTQGLTWNWGADNVSAQYSGGRMEFHSDMTRWTESSASSVSSFGSGSGSASDRDILLGVEAKGGWTFFDNDMFDASVDAGFRFYGSGDLSAESKYGTAVTTTKTRNEYRFVDSYDASGWTTVPRGAYEGSQGGPGRLIGAQPTRNEELMSSSSSSETHTYYSSSRTKLDYRIWDLRLGPSAGWKATDWLMFRGGVYGLVGLVDATMKTDVGSRGARKSECDAVFGMAAGISAQINLTEHIFVVGGAEYDWWANDVSMSAGGADAHIELSDYTISLALGIEF